MKMRKLFKKGFTLVELVVVIAVIVVLAAVSVGAYFGVTDSANSSNATVSQKQVKDYWMLYSVEDYDNSMTLSEIGDDFCIRYLTEYQGYTSTYVNYAKVTVDESVSPLAGSSSTENALLFKIETLYPTYLLVKKDRIIETSTVAKNVDEFKALIDSSTFNIIENAEEIEFELSTIQFNDGTEVKEVRGHRYLKYVVETYKGSDQLGIDSVYVSNGNSISNTDGTYLPSQFKTANGQEIDMFALEKDGETFSHSDVLYTESYNSEEKIDDQTPLYKNIKYGYVVESHNLKKIYSSEIPSIDAYPIIIYNANAGYYSFYNSFDELNYIIPLNTGEKQNTILLGDVSLDEDLLVPSGYNVVIDILNDVTSMQNITSKADYFKVDDITGGVNDENTSRLIGGSGLGTGFCGTEQVKMKDGVYTITPLSEKSLKNEFIIENDVTLTIASGSNLAVEAQVGYTQGASSAGILNYSKIINNGTINIESEATLKSIGKIIGTGEINIKPNASSYDLFKLNSFTGGTCLFKKSAFVLGGLYPILEYQIDNIQCKINFYNESKYTFLTALNTGGTTYCEKIKFIDTENAFMIDQSNNGSDQVVLVKELVNDPQDRLIYFNRFTYLNGANFVFGNISMKLELGSWFSGTLQSKDFNFPLCHLDLVINHGATLTIGKCQDKSLKVEIMPSSRIINNGTLKIIDGATLAICNFTEDNYDTIINGYKCSSRLHIFCSCINPIEDLFKPVYTYMETTFGANLSTDSLFINNKTLVGSYLSNSYEYKYFSTSLTPGENVKVGAIK